MDKKIDIHKAGGILIRDRKFLVTKSKDRPFMAPGGKLTDGETPEESLRRELGEELGITVGLGDLEKFGTFYAPAAGQEEKYLKMDVFFVRHWNGTIRASNEIEEIMWINSLLSDGIKLGSIFQHEVLPRLKKEDMID